MRVGDEIGKCLVDAPKEIPPFRLGAFVDSADKKMNESFLQPTQPIPQFVAMLVHAETCTATVGTSHGGTEMIKPISYIGRSYLAILLTFAALSLLSLPAHAQVSSKSELFATLKTCDARLFDVGYNMHDIKPFEELISDNFEFYHDKGGETVGKAAFLDSIRNGIFNLRYRARRELVPDSLVVYRLEKNGTLYGAIQMGEHRFFALEPGKPEYPTGHALFTHLWLLEDGKWKLSRILSYDHEELSAATAPSFEDAEKVNAWLKSKGIPTLGLGVIREGMLQEVRVYGELKQGTPAPLDTVFNVASVTKTVTSAVTLKLATQGLWDIDEPLAHYWIDPDVKNDPRAMQLTTRHVLNQVTGFPNWRWQSKSGKLAFEVDPGTRYGYSGEGFEYLRRALEAKFHQSLEQLASTQIFQPLGMRDTRFTWDAGLYANRFAVPHDAKGNPLPITENAEPNAADLLKTTVSDYGRFMVSVMNSDGISPVLYGQMTSATVKTKDHRFMGLGWLVYTDLPGNQTAMSHGGSDPGVQTIVFFLPASKSGLIIFTNSDNGPAVFAELISSFLKEQGRAIVDIEMK